MKILSIFLTLLLLEGSPQWGSDFEKARADAMQSKKNIVINFSGSDWCGPCIKLKKEVLDASAFLNFASKNLVLVRADFPRLKKNQLDKKQTMLNETLAEKYNPEGKFPLTVLLSADGKKIKEWEGYPSNLTIASLIGEIEKLSNARK